MKLIVGLGNPDKKYEKTRHNCGFRAIDFYAEKNNLTFKSKYNGLYSENIINGEKILLLKPQTYMNLSGTSVIKYMKFYNLDLKDLLVIYDDVDFEIGTFKIKRGGSSGGHNGMKNIIDNLKTEDIQRVRIGISKNNIELMDYVLGKFSKSEDKLLNAILPTISDIIDDFSNYDIDKLMEKYNKNNEK
ncbi:MAG: aminoacyl-tRNA hydrolase [Bacilli bacterium]|nr:aminoacyl-tRNA hydrolase [Bacilli bacterium]